MKALTIMLSLISVVACGGGGDAAAPRPTAPAATRIATTATLRILEPVHGATVRADSIPVKLELRGARLLKEAKTEPSPDEGHLHLALDGKDFYAAAGLGLTFDFAKVRMTPESGDRTPIAPGPRLLSVEFVDARHLFFEPRVLAQVQVTVT